MPKGKKAQPDKVDWSAMEQDFIVENLDPARKTPYTFADVAKKWDVAHGTVRNRAADEGWREKLREKRREQANLATEHAKKAFAFDEAEIRMRHASRADNLAKVATAHLAENIQGVMLEDGTVVKEAQRLTVAQCIDILKFAPIEERRALGLPDRLTIGHGIDTGTATSPAARRTRRAHMRKLAKALEEEIEGIEDEEGTGLAPGPDHAE